VIAESESAHHFGPDHMNRNFELKMLKMMFNLKTKMFLTLSDLTHSAECEFKRLDKSVSLLWISELDSLSVCSAFWVKQRSKYTNPSTSHFIQLCAKSTD
jgi:hypothetical protein